jgi:hypothetical protein
VELKTGISDANELKPTPEPDANSLPPLQQSNQLENAGGTSGSSSSVNSSANEEMADLSSSRKKKKKGLRKLNPF